MLSDERLGDRKFAAKQMGRDIEAFDALVELLREQGGKHYGHICVGMAEQLVKMSENERGSVLSSARTQTQWLDEERIGTHAKWFRLMILLALSVMERTRVKPPAPVLFVLDEFPVLGHMQAIETAAGLMAGFGVKLWAIMQNVGQLRRHYNKAWQTFMANAGVITAFGVTDEETLKALSSKLGHMRMAEKVSTGAVGTALLTGITCARSFSRSCTTPLLAVRPRIPSRILSVPE
jgi:type IV secretion system protein VirD4